MRTTMFLAILLSFFCAAHLALADEIGGTGFVAAQTTAVRTYVNGAAGPDLTLPAGLEFVAIESQGDLVRIGIDADPESGLPSEAWVAAEDLNHFEKTSPGLLSGDDFDILKRMTYCYRFVKMYLMKIGEVKSYLPGESAYQAASILPRFGFHRTGHGPASAHNGEVCVYSGGPQGHGHIEVKRSGKWWYGYGFINHPIQGRHFIACFAK